MWCSWCSLWCWCWASLGWEHPQGGHVRHDGVGQRDHWEEREDGSSEGGEMAAVVAELCCSLLEVVTLFLLRKFLAMGPL